MVPKESKPAKKPASKAVSIWANERDRVLFKRVSKRAERPFSEIVRALVKRYDAVGTAPGLPRLAAVKKPKAKAPKSKPKAKAELTSEYPTGPLT